MTTPVPCPHCGVVLDPVPTKTGPCPDCGNKITRRKTGGEVRYMTPDQADYRADRNKALGRLAWLGVTEADYDRKYEELRKQFGTKPARGDTYWSLANDMIVTHAGDPYVTKQLQLGMAVHLKEEGRSWRAMKEASLRAELQEVRQKSISSTVQAHQVRALADACCPACGSVNGQTFDLDDALATMLLPADDCSAEFCNCSWTAIYEPAPLDLTDEEKAAVRAALDSEDASPAEGVVKRPKRRGWFRLNR